MSKAGGPYTGHEEYGTLSIADLAALPIHELVSGYLFLWTTGPFLAEGFTLLDAWGFRYATTVVWLKKTKAGNTPYGAGYWYRGAAEMILVARRPGIPSVRTHQRNVFEAERLDHSTKPESFQTHVEACYPGPYLELFARRARPGWTCLGDECEGDGGDIRATLRSVLDGSFPIELTTTPVPAAAAVERPPLALDFGG